MSLPIKISDLLTHAKRIYLSNPDTKFSQALSNYLLTFGIPTSVLTVPLSPGSPPAAIIYFCGFKPTGLPTTLELTTQFHAHLQLARSHHCPLVLILSQPSSPIHTAAKILAHQFVHTHPQTQVILVEITTGSNPSSASPAIVRAFLPHLTTLTPSPSRPTSKYHFLTTVFWFWLVFNSLFVVQLGALYASLRCSQAALGQARWHLATTCAMAARGLAFVLPPQSYLTLVGRPFLALLQFPPSQLFAFTASFATNLTQAAQAAQLGYPYLTNLLSPTSVLPSADTTKLHTTLTALADSLLVTHRHLQHSTSPYLTSLEPVFSTAALRTAKLALLAPHLPDFLGLSGDRVYAFVLQDPAVPRPHGGLITQFGTLTLHHGQLTDVQLQPASAVDQALGGLAQPPPSFTSVTNQTTWHFADSLWDPTFSQAAAQVTWFFSKALALSPTGLFATHTGLASQLAPFSTPAQNLHQLGLLLDAFANRQLFFSSPELGDPISQLGWDGGARPPACKVASCISDAVSVTDSSLSLAPPYPTRLRSTHLTVNINAAQISSRLLLTYTSTGAPKSGSSPYLVQVQLPGHVQISSVQVNGTQLSATDYTYRSTSATEFVSLPIQLPMAQPTDILIIYDRSLSSTNLRYQLLVANQSGQLTNPLTLSLSYPTTWSAQASVKPKFAQSGQLEYNTLLTSPQSYTFDFTP